MIDIRSTSRDSNPLGPAKAKYIETVVNNQTVWVYDTRGDVSPEIASVELATTIDGWFGELRIDLGRTRTAEGPLAFSELDRENASRSLIDIVGRTAQSQSE